MLPWQVPAADQVLVTVTVPSQRWVVIRNSGKDNEEKQQLWAAHPIIPVCGKVFTKLNKMVQKNLKSQILWDLRRDQQNSVLLWVFNFLKGEKVLY